MAIFGLVSQSEHNKLLKEIESLKATMPTFERWQLETAEAEKFTLPDPSVYGNQADLYRKLSWVMLAVDLVASAGALTPFDVLRVISEKEPKDIPNHEFELLLSRPNDMDSRYEFLYATIAFFKLTGNAYWWLNKKDEYSKPDEMWFIPSQMITPVPDEKMYLKGYIYYPGNGREIFLEPHEIVHFKRFNPFSRFIGLSAIESIALVAQGDLGMQDWNTRLFRENNARLPGILTFEQMVADQTWNKIKEDTREASKSRELLMLRGVGQGGVQWLQHSVSQREMEFLAGRRANKEEIMTAIAKGSYTMLSENATQANSVVGRASFNELEVYPTHVMMAEKITNSILPLYGGRQLIGRFEDIRVTDKDLEMREQEAFERTHTVKEVREEYYGDDPLGDERDDLLPSQITQTSGQPEPPPPPVVNNVTPDKPMQELPQTEPNNNDAQEPVKADLARWQRKALKKIGQFVPFESDVIPQYLREQIESALPACKTEGDVRRVFSTKNKSDILVLAEAINKAVQSETK